MPPHRALMAHLALALECLDEAVALDAYLPHWAQQQVSTMADELADVLDAVAREIPALAQDASDEC
jgi:hypothetical protein